MIDEMMLPSRLAKEFIEYCAKQMGTTPVRFAMVKYRPVDRSTLFFAQAANDITALMVTDVPTQDDFSDRLLNNSFFGPFSKAHGTPEQTRRLAENIEQIGIDDPQNPPSKISLLQYLYKNHVGMDKGTLTFLASTQRVPSPQEDHHYIIRTTTLLEPLQANEAQFLSTGERYCVHLYLVHPLCHIELPATATGSIVAGGISCLLTGYHHLMDDRPGDVQKFVQPPNRRELGHKGPEEYEAGKLKEFTRVLDGASIFRDAVSHIEPQLMNLTRQYLQLRERRETHQSKTAHDSPNEVHP